MFPKSSRHYIKDLLGHTVPGIGRCDRDKFNGSLTALKKLWA